MIDMNVNSLSRLYDNEPKRFQYTNDTNMIEFLISQGVEVVENIYYDYEYNVGGTFRLGYWEYDGQPYRYKTVGQVVRRRLSPNDKQEDPLWYSRKPSVENGGTDGLFWQLVYSGSIVKDLNDRNKPAFIAEGGLVIIFDKPEEYPLPERIISKYNDIDIKTSELESFAIVLDPTKVKIIKWVPDPVHNRMQEPQWYILPEYITEGTLATSNYIYFHKKDQDENNV